MSHFFKGNGAWLTDVPFDGNLFFILNHCGPRSFALESAQMGKVHATLSSRTFVIALFDY